VIGDSALDECILEGHWNQRIVVNPHGPENEWGGAKLGGGARVSEKKKKKKNPKKLPRRLRFFPVLFELKTIWTVFQAKE